MVHLQIEEIITALMAECYARRNFLFALFVVISLAFLAAGSIWPKKYTSSVVIQIDASNILQPLMAGTAETTRPIDHVANAREIIFGEKIVGKVLQDAGWLELNPDEIEQERIKEIIKSKVVVSGVGEGLIRISYQDSDPMRSYITVNTMADAFINEGELAKIEESQAAYEFIEKQVEEYLQKLTQVEEELRDFRNNNPDARPGLEAEVLNRITQLKASVEQSELDIREALIQKDSLEKQLSGEAAITISQSREGQYRSKIAELQAQVETLRLDYHESYPDITRLKSQITDLKMALNAEIEQRKIVAENTRQQGGVYVDDAILLNPLYQELRSNLSSTETRIATLRARVSELNKILDNEYQRAERIHGGEATLSKLTRDYQVNQEIYQDLLRRRENARVSRSLDVEQQGLTFKIQEPSKIPLIPSGVRFIHFAIAGIVLGILTPVGFIYLLLQLDPRVYYSRIISNDLELPVIAEINRFQSQSEIEKAKSNLIFILIGMLLVFSIYGLVGWMKYTGNI